MKPEKELRVKQGIYDEAIIELEKGKYEKGIELLKTISDFGDTATVIEQAKYESYALSSVNAVKAVLKNPDSIIIHEVRFYNDFDEVNDETEKLSIEEQEKETSTEAKKEETFSQYPVVVIHYGAQNGFGGNTPGYAYCQYSEESDKYEIEGLTDELDIDELDKDDENYLLYLFSASKINSYLDTGEEIGDIDEGRFDSVLRNAAYSSIKVIE